MTQHFLQADAPNNGAPLKEALDLEYGKAMTPLRAGVLKIVVWLELFLFFLPVLAWPFLFLMSVLSFDAPGSEKNPIMLGLVAVALGYPLLYLLGAIMAIQKLRSQNLESAVKYASLPTLGFIAFGFLFWLLQKICEGKFTC